jgi:hypothetical protein
LLASTSISANGFRDRSARFLSRDKSFTNNSSENSGDVPFSGENVWP